MLRLAQVESEGCFLGDPRRVAGVWIVGMLRGETLSVALTRLCETDTELRWVCGGAQVKKSASAHRPGQRRYDHTFRFVHCVISCLCCSLIGQS